MHAQKDLFISATEGYHTFRIPSVVTTVKGTVLAFCEGRKNDSHDSGDIALLLKRSEDGGASWSDLHIVWDDPGHTCGNPCPVVDRKSGAVCLLMTHNLGSDVEPQIIAETSRGSRTVWLSRSFDDGLSWSAPTDLSATTKKPSWTWYATGPGAGIQQASGRLTIPCDHIEAGSKKYYSHIIYSDDGGSTWALGGSTPSDQVNECEVAQLDDGRLLLNMRNYDPAHRTRVRSYSADGGLSWSALERDEGLIEPICQASLRRFTNAAEGDRSRLLFANPASPRARENMTVRLSYDEGLSWPVARVLHPGPAAYSCLTVLPDRTLACLYERGDENPREKITWEHFDLEWLTEGKDRL